MISIIAPALFVPLGVISIFLGWCFFSLWYSRLDFPPDKIAVPTSATLAFVRSSPTVLTPAATASTEPTATASASPAKPPVLGDAPPVTAEPTQNAATAASPATPVQPAVKSLSPRPSEQAALPPEAIATRLDAKETKSVLAPPIFATLAAIPPTPREVPLGFTNPSQGTSPAATPVTPVEPAASAQARLMEGPVRLPTPRPHIVVASNRRSAPLPRRRPIE